MNIIAQEAHFRQRVVKYGYFNFRVDVNKHFTINKMLILQTIPLEIIYK